MQHSHFASDWHAASTFSILNAYCIPTCSGVKKCICLLLCNISSRNCLQPLWKFLITVCCHYPIKWYIWGLMSLSTMRWYTHHRIIFFCNRTYINFLMAGLCISNADFVFQAPLQMTNNGSAIAKAPHPSSSLTNG